MENRFVEMDSQLRTKAALRGHRRNGLATHGVQLSGYARPLSASDRVLVVLIENRGVDLFIPELVDRLLSLLPLSGVISDERRAELVEYLRRKIKEMTDALLETAELSLNRYTAAKPNLYGDVVVLRDSTASDRDLKDTLIRLSRAGKIIDLLVLTHGGRDSIDVNGNINSEKIRAMKQENGRPLSLRSVYMMSCNGSTLNQAWLDAGAKTSSGAAVVNYLPEPTTFFFWRNWKAGQTFVTASTGAYQQTIAAINGAIRAYVTALPVPGASLIASQIDVSGLDFVRQSRPLIAGQGELTISSDNLSFSQTVSGAFMTTVVPSSALSSHAPSGETAPAAARGVRSVSPHGMELIRRWEGDAPGLADRIAAAQQAVADLVTGALTQEQLDALVSFVVNVGTEAFRTSTLLHLLNGGKHSAVPAELAKWVKARRNASVVDVPELAERRSAEAAMFQGRSSAPVTAQSLLADRFSQPSGAVDARISGVFHPIRQPTPMTCWAAVFTMMYSWRKQVSIAIRDALATVGQVYVERFDAGRGLDVDTARELYNAAGMEAIISTNPTIDHWAELIRTYGPLYVDIGFGESNVTHALIVTGISGDGTARGTRVTYVDPGDASTQTVSFEAFLQGYEAPGAVRGWPFTIVHWKQPEPAAAQSLTAQQFSSYRSPSNVVSSLSRLSYQQNPVVAGIAIADAVQIGLGAVAIVQAQVSASQGSFTLTYAQAQRLLTNEARQAMPGAQAAKQTYRHGLLSLGIERLNAANAEVIIEWEGNAYGEIGTPVIRRDLATSSEWSRSSANITINKIDRIPLPNTDPRTWPIVYSYEGTYDPWGNGYFEFTGEFEVNAFGGLKFNRHEVVSRALADWALGGRPEDYVVKGRDVTVAVPQIPQEQLNYLRTRLP